jgi:hypothetical protein
MARASTINALISAMMMPIISPVAKYICLSFLVGY